MKMSTGSTRFVLGCVAVVALLGAACGSSSPSTSGTTPPTTSPSASGGGATTLTQGAGGQLVFSPTTLTVKTGASVDVKNVSTVPHNFTVTGKDINVTNTAGQSQTVTINLSPGTYPFVCSFHVAQGMKGTLTVTG